jgi:FlaA1/EpsC-like NDP-sugar epimerase
MKDTIRSRKFLFGAMQLILDLSVLIGAFLLAYLLRFDFQLPAGIVPRVMVQLPFVVLLQFVALSLSGSRNFMWRYTEMAHIKSFLVAALTSLAVVFLLRVFLREPHQVARIPHSVNLFDCVLAFGAAFALRVLRRAVYEYDKRRGQLREYGDGNKSAVLLIGAGQAGVLSAKEIEGRGDLNLEIRGFVDDDPIKRGRTVVRKHRVLGTTLDLPRLVKSMEIDHVVITISQAPRQEIMRIVKICEEIPVRVRIIPGLYELLEGRVEISRIRDVQIEDLLGREPVALDIESISRELAGKTVMVTGAGGSIGSELARQVVRFAPAQLLLVERAEFALFNIDRELRGLAQTASIVPLVADIGDVARMRSIFAQYRPQVVIHAAAHKHVPLMEYNPAEAIKNNVLNTKLLSEFAAAFEAEVFVLISTDKAVRPTSIMGASKRLAELVVQCVGNESKTRFVAVRFGNVIGSNGSAIPIFQEQIRKGGPLTITDKRMRRYFMTIPEAAQLVLQASTIGKGGEVFILHMGEPVSIMELAATLISLSGLRPHHDIKIVETGIRPGEKLNEELMFENEETAATCHPKIFVSKISPPDKTAIENGLQSLTELLHERDEAKLRSFLNWLIPEAQVDTAELENGVEQREEPLTAVQAQSVATFG